MVDAFESVSANLSGDNITAANADVIAQNGFINGIRIVATGGDGLDQLTPTPTTFDVLLRALDTDATGNGTIDNVIVNAIGGVFARANDGFDGGEMTSTTDSVSVLADTGNIEDLDITSNGNGAAPDGTAQMVATTGDILNSRAITTGAISTATINAVAGTIFGGNAISADNVDVDAGTSIIGLQTSSVDDGFIDAGIDILDSIFTASSLNPAEGDITIVNFNDFAGNTVTATGDVLLDASVFIVGNAFRVTGDLGIGTDPGGAIGFPVGFVTGNEIDGDGDVEIIADGDITGGAINTSGDIDLTTSIGLGGDVIGVEIASVGGVGDITVKADDNITGNTIQAAGEVTLDATEGDITGGTVDSKGDVSVTVDQGNIDGIHINASDIVTLDADAAGTDGGAGTTNQSNIRNAEVTGTIITVNAEVDIDNTSLISTTGAVTVTAESVGAANGNITNLFVLSADTATVDAEDGAVNDSDITGTSVDLDADSIEGGSVLATTTKAVVDTRDNGDIVNLEVTAELGLADVSADGSIDGAIVRADDTDIDGDNIFNGSVTVIGTDAFDDAELDATSGDISGVTVVSANTANLNANTGNIVNNNIQAAETINLGTDGTTVNVNGNAIEGDTDSDGGVIDINATTDVSGNTISSNDTTATSVTVDARNVVGNVVTSAGTVDLEDNNGGAGLADITGNTVNAAVDVILLSDVDITGGTYLAGDSVTATATAGDIDGVTINAGSTNAADANAVLTATDVLNSTITVVDATSLVDIQATAGSVSGNTISSSNDVEIDATADVVNTSIDAVDTVTIDTGAGTVVNVSNVDIQADGVIDVNAIGDLDGSSIVGFNLVTIDANDITDSGASGVDVVVTATTQGADVADITNLTVETTGTAATEEATVTADGSMNQVTIDSATNAVVSAGIDIAEIDITAASTTIDTTVDAGTAGSGNIAGGTIQLDGDLDIDAKRSGADDGDITGLVIEANAIEIGVDVSMNDVVGVEANINDSIDIDLFGDVEGSIFVSETGLIDVDVNDIRESGFTGSTVDLATVRDIIGGEATATGASVTAKSGGLMNGINVDAATTVDLTSTASDIVDVGVTAGGNVTLTASGAFTGDITGSTIDTPGTVTIDAPESVTGNVINSSFTNDLPAAISGFDVSLKGRLLTGNIIHSNDSVRLEADDSFGIGIAFATGNIIDADFGVTIDSDGEITGGTINAGDDVNLITGSGGLIGNDVTGVSISGRRNVTIDSGENIIDVSINSALAATLTADLTISGGTILSGNFVNLTASDDPLLPGDIDGITVIADSTITLKTDAGSVSNASFTSTGANVDFTQVSLDVTATDVSALTAITATIGRNIIDGSFLSEDAGIDFDLAGGSIIGATFTTLDISNDSDDSILLDAEFDINGITVDSDADVDIGLDAGGDITDTDNILGVVVDADGAVDFEARVNIQGGNIHADGTADFLSTNGDIDGITVTAVDAITATTKAATGRSISNASFASTTKSVTLDSNIDLVAVGATAETTVNALAGQRFVDGSYVSNTSTVTLKATAGDVDGPTVDAVTKAEVTAVAASIANADITSQTDEVVITAALDVSATDVSAFTTITADIGRDIVDGSYLTEQGIIDIELSAGSITGATFTALDADGSGDGDVNLDAEADITGATINADDDVNIGLDGAITTEFITGSAVTSGGTTTITAIQSIDGSSINSGGVVTLTASDGVTGGDITGNSVETVSTVALDALNSVTGNVINSTFSDDAPAAFDFDITIEGAFVTGNVVHTNDSVLITADDPFNFGIAFATGNVIDADFGVTIDSEGEITGGTINAGDDVSLVSGAGGSLGNDIAGVEISGREDVSVDSGENVIDLTINSGGDTIILADRSISGGSVLAGESATITASDDPATPGDIDAITVTADTTITASTDDGSISNSNFTSTSADVDIDASLDVIATDANAETGVDVLAGEGIIAGSYVSNTTTVTLKATAADIDGPTVNAAGTATVNAVAGSVSNSDITSTGADVDLDAGTDITSSNVSALTDISVLAAQSIIEGTYLAEDGMVDIDATASDIDGIVISTLNRDANNPNTAIVDVLAGGDIVGIAVDAVGDVTVNGAFLVANEILTENNVDVDASGTSTGNEIDSDGTVDFLSEGDITGGSINASDDVRIESKSQSIIGTTISTPTIGTVTMIAEVDISGVEINAGQDAIVTADTGDIIGGSVNAGIEGAINAIATLTASDGSIDGTLVTAVDTITVVADGGDIRNVDATSFEDNVIFNADEDISQSDVVAKTTAVLTADFDTSGDGDIVGGSVDVKGEGTAAADITLTAVNIDDIVARTDAADLIVATALPSGAAAAAINGATFDADTVTLTADTGIGNTDEVSVEGTETITLDNRTGNIFAESTNNNVTELIATNGDAGGDTGNVVFSHNGSGVLTVTDITTIDGSITVNSEPSVNAVNVVAGGADSDIFITVDTGNLDFVLVAAVADRVEMNVFGNITGNDVGTDIVRSADLEANAGGNVDILTDIDNFEGIIDGTLDLTESNAVTLLDVEIDGTANVTATLGDITAVRVISSDDNVTVNALDEDIIVTGLINAGFGTVNLNADHLLNGNVGTITGGGDQLPDVIAATVNLDADGEITIDTSAQVVNADQMQATAGATHDISIVNTSVITATATLNAAGTTGSDITFDQVGGGNLTIASAVTAEGNVSSTIDDADLTATVITAGGAGDVTLSTTGNGGITLGVITAIDDEVTLTAIDSIEESAATAAVENIIADTLDIDGGSNVGTAASPIDTTIDVLQIADVIGPVTLVETGNTTGTNVASIDTEDVTVGSLVNVGGDFSLTATAGDIEASSITALEDTVTLIAPEGAIFENNAADGDIAAGTLVMIAQDGIGSAIALDTSVGTLDAQNLDGTSAAAGNIQINETNAIAIDRILQNADAGTVSVIANAGSILLNEDQSGVVAETGQVDLDARGAESSVAVNDGVTTSSGNINIVADDDVLFGAEGDVTSTSGNVVVTADDDTTGAPFGGEIFMADVDGDSAVINAGTGTITVTADEDITVGSLVTNSAAGGDEIVIDSTSGEVLDGGDSAVDIVMAVAAAEIQIDAEEGIGSGSSGALEMSGIDSLDADTTTGRVALSNVADEAVTVNSITTGGGNISYVQTGDQALTLTTVTTTDGDVTISASGTAAADVDITTVSADTADDTVTITATGAITATLAAANTEIVGATIDLTADDGGIGVGNSFDVNATVSFSADTRVDAGAIMVTDVVGDLPIGLVQADTGTVTLTSTLGEILDASADTATDIAADVVVLDGETGVGGTATLELSSTITLNADVTGVAGSIGISNASDADVTVNSLTTPDGDITYVQTGANNDLLLDTVTADLVDDTVTLSAEGGIDLVAAADAAANVAAANISLTTTAQGIGTASGAGFGPVEVNATVSLTADSSADGSNILIDDLVGDMPVQLITAGAGDVTLTAAAGIEETAAADDDADIVGATVTLTANGGGIGATATIEVDVTAELDADSTTADGNIDLSDLAGGFPIGVVDADTGTVTLASVGAVSDADADGALNVDASTLTIAAVSGIGNGDAIETTVDDVDLSNTPALGADATANIEITELVAGADLIITNAIQGDVGVEATNSGDILISTEEGNLTVAAGGATTARDGGIITLTAGDDGGAGSFDVLIDGSVLSTVGLKDQGVGQVTPGTVTILADDDVRFSTPGTVTVNQTLIDDTTQAPVTSLAGLVDIDATEGSILELDTGADADAEILAETIDLRAENGDIAQETTASALEIDSGTATVNADVSDTDGVINITEVDGEMVVGVVDAGAGSVTLTATDVVDGAIVASDAATVEITADTIDLNAETGIGTGANGALDLSSVVSLDADSTTGAVDLDVDADAAVVVNSVTTAAGSITVDQSGGDFDMTVELGTTGDGDVTFTNAGGTSADIIVDTITADLLDDTVTLDAEGLIDAQNAAGAAEIAAATISLIADNGGIGVSNANLFEVNATVSFSADTRNDDAAITVTDIVGDLPIGLVQADTGTVTLASTLGEILDASADKATDIAADVVDLDGATGVGGTATLELSSTITLDADVTGVAGSIGIINASDADVTVNSLTTPNGNITYAQTGANNDLLLDTVTADLVDDTVTLSAEGGIDLVAATDSAANVAAANISLTTTAEGIGTASGVGFGPVEVNATVSLNADTSADNSAILIDDVTGGMSVALITAGTGNVTLNADAGIEESGADAEADIVGGTVTLTSGTGGAGGIGATATVEVDVIDELDATTALGAADHIDLSDVAGDLPLGTLDAGLGDVTLASVGAVTDVDADATADIAGDALVIDAVNGVGSGDAIETEVTSIDVDNVPAAGANATGNIEIVELAAGTTLEVLNAVQGDVSVEATNTGNIDIETEDDTLTVSGAVTARDGGTIALEAGSATDAGDVFVNAAVSSLVGLKDQGVGIVNAGNVTVTAGNDIIFGAAAGAILITEDILNQTNGSITVVQAGTANLVADDDIFEADGVDDVDPEITAETINLTATAGNVGQAGDSDATPETLTGTLEVDSGPATVNVTAFGDIDVTETEGTMEVGLVESTNRDSVTLTAITGGIEESGDDALGDILGGVLVLTAKGGGVGANGTLEIESTDLSADSSTTGGDIDLSEIAAGADLDVNLVTAGTGNVTLDSEAGAIDDLQTDGDNDITGTGIALTAVLGIGDSEPLELAGTTISADNTTKGNVDLDNVLATEVTVTSLTTAGGATILFEQSGGGGVSFATVTTVTDGGPADGEDDITLKSDSGNMTITGPVTADGEGDVSYTTTASGDVILTGTTTADDNTVTILSVDAINGAGLVTAETVDLDADDEIGGTTALELTTVTSLDADVATAGAIDIDNLADAAAAVNNLSTPAGSIAYDQEGNFGATITRVVTGNGDVTITNSDGTGADIAIFSAVGLPGVEADVADDTVTISASGAITATDDDAEAEVVGATVTLQAGDGGIGTDGANADGNSFDINATVAFNADTGRGDDGNITVDDIVDDLPIGLITADAGTVTLTSVGAIDDATVDEVTDFVADTVDLTSEDGIGATQEIEMFSVETLRGLVNTGGAIDIDAIAEADVTVELLDTPTGTIDYDQSGNFELELERVVTGDGDITITNVGGLDADIVIFSDADTVSVPVDPGVEADPDDDTIRILADGAIEAENADGAADPEIEIRGFRLDLDAVEGIGADSSVEGEDVGIDTAASIVLADTTGLGEAAISIDNIGDASTELSTRGIRAGITFNNDGTLTVDSAVTVEGGGIGIDATASLFVQGAVETKDDVSLSAADEVEITVDKGFVTAGGGVDIEARAGPVDVDGPVTADGAITAKATGGDVQVDADVRATGSGSIDIESTDADVEVAFAGNALISGVDGDIILDGVNVTLGDAGDNNSAEVATSGTGSVQITADDTFLMNANAGTIVNAGGSIDADAETATIDGGGLLAVENIDVDVTDVVNVNATVESTRGEVTIDADDTDDDGEASVIIDGDIIAENAVITATDGDASETDELIEVNDSDGDGIGTRNLRGSTTFEANDGELNINGDVFAAEDLDLLADGLIALSADLLAEDDITVHDLLTIDDVDGGGVTMAITSLTGDIDFQGITEADAAGSDLDLVVTALAGTVILNGAVNDAGADKEELNNFTVSADLLRVVDGTITVETDIDFGETDRVQLEANTVVTSNAGDVFFNPDGFVDSDDPSTVRDLQVVAASTGGDVVFGTAGSDVPLQNLDIDAGDPSDVGSSGFVTLNGNIEATGVIDLRDEIVVLSNDISVRTSGAMPDLIGLDAILFDDDVATARLNSVDGNFDLILTADVGDIRLTNSGQIDTLDDVTITAQGGDVFVDLLDLGGTLSLEGDNVTATDLSGTDDSFLVNPGINAAQGDAFVEVDTGITGGGINASSDVDLDTGTHIAGLAISAGNDVNVDSGGAITGSDVVAGNIADLDSPVDISGTTVDSKRAVLTAVDLVGNVVNAGVNDAVLTATGSIQGGNVNTTGDADLDAGDQIDGIEVTAVADVTATADSDIVASSFISSEDDVSLDSGGSIIDSTIFVKDDDNSNSNFALVAADEEIDGVTVESAQTVTVTAGTFITGGNFISEEGDVDIDALDGAIIDSSAVVKDEDGSSDDFATIDATMDVTGVTADVVGDLTVGGTAAVNIVNLTASVSEDVILTATRNITGAVVDSDTADVDGDNISGGTFDVAGLAAIDANNGDVTGTVINSGSLNLGIDPLTVTLDLVGVEANVVNDINVVTTGDVEGSEFVSGSGSVSVDVDDVRDSGFTGTDVSFVVAGDIIDSTATATVTSVEGTAGGTINALTIDSALDVALTAGQDILGSNVTAGDLVVLTSTTGNVQSVSVNADGAVSVFAELEIDGNEVTAGQVIRLEAGRDIVDGFYISETADVDALARDGIIEGINVVTKDMDGSGDDRVDLVAGVDIEFVNVTANGTADLIAGGRINGASGSSTGTTSLVAEDIIKDANWIADDRLLLTAGKGIKGGDLVSSGADVVLTAGENIEDSIVKAATNAELTSSQSIVEVAVSATTANLTATVGIDGGSVDTTSDSTLTGGSIDDVVVRTDGGDLITATANTGAINGGNFSADSLVLTGTTGIGNRQQLVLDGVEQITIANATGNIAVANRNDLATNLAIDGDGTGEVDYVQTGSGELTISEISTENGSIDVTAEARVIAGNITSAGDGDIVVTVSEDSLIFNNLTASDDRVTVDVLGNAVGGLVTASEFFVDAGGNVETTTTVDVVQMNVGGTAIVAELDGFMVQNSHTDGPAILIARSGDVSIQRLTTSDDAVTITAETGSIGVAGFDLPGYLDAGTGKVTLLAPQGMISGGGDDIPDVVGAAIEIAAGGEVTLDTGSTAITAGTTFSGGDIDLVNTSDQDTNVSSVTVGSGSAIVITQLGAGDLNVRDVTTASGDVGLISKGSSVNVNENVVAGSGSELNIEADENVRIRADLITTGAARVVADSDGDLAGNLEMSEGTILQATHITVDGSNVFLENVSASESVVGSAYNLYEIDGVLSAAQRVNLSTDVGNVVNDGEIRAGERIDIQSGASIEGDNPRSLIVAPIVSLQAVNNVGVSNSSELELVIDSPDITIFTSGNDGGIYFTSDAAVEGEIEPVQIVAASRGEDSHIQIDSLAGNLTNLAQVTTNDGDIELTAAGPIRAQFVRARDVAGGRADATAEAGHRDRGPGINGVFNDAHSIVLKTVADADMEIVDVAADADVVLQTAGQGDIFVRADAIFAGTNFDVTMANGDILDIDNTDEVNITALDTIIFSVNGRIGDPFNPLEINAGQRAIVDGTGVEPQLPHYATITGLIRGGTDPASLEYIGPTPPGIITYRSVVTGGPPGLVFSGLRGESFFQEVIDKRQDGEQLAIFILSPLYFSHSVAINHPYFPGIPAIETINKGAIKIYGVPVNLDVEIDVNILLDQDRDFRFQAPKYLDTLNPFSDTEPESEPTPEFDLDDMASEEEE